MKVTDSQNVSIPNGAQLSQRKQLEILQAHTSTGSLQVVKAQTVQSSSSRWSSTSLTKGNTGIKPIQHLLSPSLHVNNLMVLTLIYKIDMLIIKNVIN